MSVGAGLALLTAGLWLGLSVRAPHRFSLDEIAGYTLTWRELTALFPRQLRGVTFDATGSRLELSEHADLPEVPPLLVRVCAAGGCQSFVTFSGQQISAAGQRYEVLSDARGGVLLVGSDAVWSSAEPNGRFSIAVQSLTEKL